MKRILAISLAVASVAAFHAGPANANCGLTVTFDNDLKKAITVLEVDSQTVGKPWAHTSTNEFRVGAGKKVTKAVSTPQGCGAQALRAKYKVGSATKYKLKSPLATLVDKKITIKFK